MNHEGSNTKRLRGAKLIEQICQRNQTAQRKRIPKMQKTRKNTIILCLSIACIIGLTSLAGLISSIEIVWLRLAAFVVVNLLNGLTAFTAMRLMKMKIYIDFINKRHYLIGCVIALILSLVIAVIPAVCGFSLVGKHTNWSWPTLAFQLLFCMLIIGPVEEFIFRVYLQDVFVSLFERHPWLGVVIAALLFGLFHLINGNLIQVLFTFGIGLVFGLAKYRIKDCGYVGVAIGHGLYDFLNVVVRMLIV